MSFSTCPVATIAAPIERVWGLLADPAQYARWWDAQTLSITPAGPASLGQRVTARTTALGWRWDIQITVQSVTPEAHRLELVTRLPLGVTGFNHISCAPVDDRHTRVGFG